jgi:hypothetical protein
MQLQYLKRVRSSLNLWPPVDTARYGLRDSPRLRQAGLLTDVRRIGNRLSVTIQFDGRDHIIFRNKPPRV